MRRLTPSTLPRERRAVDGDTLAAAGAIVRAVEREGDVALRRYGEQHDGLGAGAALVLDRAALQAALTSLPSEQRALLERTRDRIAAFAQAQRDAIGDVTVDIPGGRIGHRVAPVASAGCYAPGGGYPLPSSVLMTAVTARVAGVEHVLVASPRPQPITLAAAAVADADALITVGGAHAIAALAHGTASVPRVDVIVGPGNRWVTAAKQLVSGRVGIDMLAGPSELLVFADDSADASMVAADLLAQAEHAPDALPMLVTTSAALIDAVDGAIDEQLTTLATADVARCAIAGGFSVLCASMDEAIAVCNELAPEHLQLCVRDASVRDRLAHYGALFLGSAAEVLGDYGTGPNHVLPTGATARFTGGLSVLTFLRLRTFIDIDDDTLAPYADAAALADLEGLSAHAAAARRRIR
jgi:phosphoribosyl-ATP pyrophosphohydrolase/phosphoribosyl-AMP cyclohydrolase/histidinol dehydrogenase